MTFKVDGANGLTFPDTTTQAVSALTAGKLATAKMPTGSILQVVNTQYPTNVTLSTTSITATGISATITPSSTSSKILALVSINGCGINNGSTPNSLHFELYRNGSSITYMEDILSYNIANVNMSASYQYLDSPASTSALTYAIWWRAQASGTIFLNNYYSSANRTVSSITLMEIAG
jgi:hypothetical protein